MEESGRTKVFEHRARLSTAIAVLGVFAASVACSPMKTVAPDGRVVRHHFGYVRIVDPPKASSKGRFDVLEVSSYGVRIHHGVGLGYFHTREEQIPLDCRLVVRVQNKEQMREVLDNLAPIIKEGLCVTVD